MKGKQFGSTEVAYQHMKAEAMNDYDAASNIMRAQTALHAMRIGKKKLMNNGHKEK